jgi:hypothetical protein
MNAISYERTLGADAVPESNGDLPVTLPIDLTADEVTLQSLSETGGERKRR